MILSIYLMFENTEQKADPWSLLMRSGKQE